MAPGSKKWLPWVCTIVLFACGRQDKNARIFTGSATMTLAVGAVHGIGLADACHGQGFSACRSEELLSLEVVMSSDDDVLEPLRVSQLSGPLKSVDVPWLIAGRSPGTAVVELSGLFSDGTTRKASAEFQVMEPSKLLAGIHCPGDPNGTTRLFPPGREVVLSVVPSAGTLKLDGLILDVLQGAQLTQQLTLSGSMFYTWLSPDEPGTTTIRAEQFPDFSLELTTFDLKDVEIQRVDTPELTRFKRNQRHGFGVDQIVHGQTPCFAVHVRARTETPEVCAGSVGATEWVESSPGGVRFTVVGSGVCRMSLTAEGSKAAVTQVEFAYEVVDD